MFPLPHYEGSELPAARCSCASPGRAASARAAPRGAAAAAGAAAGLPCARWGAAARAVRKSSKQKPTKAAKAAAPRAPAATRGGVAASAGSKVKAWRESTKDDLDGLAEVYGADLLEVPPQWLTWTEAAATLTRANLKIPTCRSGRIIAVPLEVPAHPADLKQTQTVHFLGLYGGCGNLEAEFLQQNLQVIQYKLINHRHRIN